MEELMLGTQVYIQLMVELMLVLLNHYRFI